MKKRIKKIKEYFKKEELVCKHCGEYKTVSDAFTRLNQLRELDGKPMILTSAYRCEEYNKEIGGAKKSYHVKGMAFDIRLDGRDIKKLAKLARSVGFNGIGTYDTFIHVDTRENKASWSGK